MSMRIARLAVTHLTVLAATAGCDGTAQVNEAESTFDNVEEGLQSMSRLQPMSPTVCWVKDPESTTSDAAFDAKAAAYEEVMREWEEESGLRFQFEGRCSAPAREFDAEAGEWIDVFSEDIRILINEKGRGNEYMIPGDGCAEDNCPGTSSSCSGNWGGWPQWKTRFRSCQHTASFGSSLSRNNILHETGHTLGYLHEHARTDNSSECQGSEDRSDGYWLTDYDVKSVMHYTWSQCGAPGNKGDTGLSFMDRLGSGIAYPEREDGRVRIDHQGLLFGLGGLYVVREDAVIRPAWYTRGAKARVFEELAWSKDFIDTPNEHVSSELAVPISEFWGPDGGGFMHLDFVDPWDRVKSADAFIYVSTAYHTAVTSVVVSGVM